MDLYARAGGVDTADAASLCRALPRKQQSLRKQEMDGILQRQQQLEETNRQLCDRAGQLRRSLRELDVPQARYQELQALPDDKLSIPEYVAVSEGVGGGGRGGLLFWC